MIAREPNLILGIVSPTATPTPTKIPTPTAIPQSSLETTVELPQSNYHGQTNGNNPVSYQDYGWYIHEGKSMQYVNGQWYTTPQEASANTPDTQTANGGNSYLNQFVNCQTSTGTFLLTPQQCTDAQKTDAESRKIQYNNNPQPTQQTTDYYKQCISQANSTHQGLVVRHKEMYGQDANTALLDQGRDYALAQCQSYPH